MNGNIDKANQDKYAEEEIDLLGLLFEKYVNGAIYNRDEKTVTVQRGSIYPE